MLGAHPHTYCFSYCPEPHRYHESPCFPGDASNHLPYEANGEDCEEEGIAAKRGIITIDGRFNRTGRVDVRTIVGRAGIVRHLVRLCSEL